MSVGGGMEKSRGFKAVQHRAAGHVKKYDAWGGKKRGILQFWSFCGALNQVIRCAAQ